MKTIFAGNCLKFFFLVYTDNADQYAVVQVWEALKDDEVKVPALEDLEEDLGTVEELTDGKSLANSQSGGQLCRKGKDVRDLDYLQSCV